MLASCKVGPNYSGPPALAPNHIARATFQRAGENSPGPVEARWWTALGDDELNRLVDLALAENPDLDAARARLRQSRASLRQARANELPTTGTTAAYLRTKNIGSLLGGGSSGAANTGSASTSSGASQQNASQQSALELYTVGFDASWEIDFFGGKARAAESAKAQAEAYEADLQDAYVTLTAEIAQAYVTLRDIQQRVALSQRNADIEERMLALTQKRRDAGTASDLDIERLNSQLQSTRADLVPLQAQIVEQLNRLAMLTGREPGALDNELVAVAAVPLPPATVNIGNPADLLRRRPDIRAAERRLAQQTATIGQHTAELFPKVQLLGDVGYVSSDLARLFTPNNFIYVVAPVLQWSPFDFGRTQAKIGAAKAVRDEALANYRKAVLGALQDAETALSRYGRQRENVAGLLRVQKSAERASELTQLRLRGGTASTLDELDAERQRVQAETGVAQAQAQLTQDFVALQKSLGLGWM
jgi:NodT family efflux transporter outer membrane factor (OMF) lipoprotein